MSVVETAVYGRLPGRFWGGGSYDSNVFECDGYRHGNPEKVDHPTQKPLSLILWHVGLTVDKGNLVLDPFMGSGTTGVACLNTGRRFIGIEKKQKYFDIACRRIEAASKNIDLFGGSQESIFTRKKGMPRAKPVFNLLLNEET